GILPRWLGPSAHARSERCRRLWARQLEDEVEDPVVEKLVQGGCHSRAREKPRAERDVGVPARAARGEQPDAENAATAERGKNTEGDALPRQPSQPQAQHGGKLDVTHPQAGRFHYGQQEETRPDDEGGEHAPPQRRPVSAVPAGGGKQE